MSHLATLINDLALILICAGVMTLLFKKLKQPLVLGYVVAGFLASPHMPYTPSVMDTANIQTWADIGVVFLLFALGLEFSFKKLMKVGGPAIIAALTIIVGMMVLGFIVGVAMGWKQMIMPLFCLSLGGIASTTRQTRSSMLEVIRQDYIRTARSKGIANNKVIYLHALKNALIPVITILGMRLGNLIAGSMFVESVFNIPGMGSLMVKAIQSRDIPVVQACVLAIALVSCLVNLATDILYAVVDPRVRFE